MNTNLHRMRILAIAVACAIGVAHAQEGDYSLGVNDDYFLGPWQADAGPAKSAAPAAAVAAKPEPKPEPKPAPVAAKPEPKPAPKPAVAAAKPEPKPAAKPASSGGSVVGAVIGAAAGAAAAASATAGAAAATTGAAAGAATSTAGAAVSAAAPRSAAPAPRPAAPAAAPVVTAAPAPVAPPAVEAKPAAPVVETAAAPAMTPEMLAAAAAAAPPPDEPQPGADVPWATERALKYVSSVDAGVLHVSDPSFRFGQYSGLIEDGAYLTFDADIKARAKHDSKSAAFIDARVKGVLSGDDLEFADRAEGTTREDRNLGGISAAIKAGEQGKYKVGLEYEQFSQFKSNSGVSPYLGIGTGYLQEPAGWDAGVVDGPADADATVGNTSSDLYFSHPTLFNGVDLEQQRRRGKATYSHLLTPAVEVKVAVQREDKEGLKSIGMYGAGGGFRTVIGIEPVDYTTDTIEVSAVYASAELQVSAGYLLSDFKNAIDALRWDHLYVGTAGAGFSDQGQHALPPDNRFQQFFVNGGWNRGIHRVAWDIASGRMEQNEAFLPYTVNPNVVISTALPRTSLQGEIDTLRALLSYQARISRAMTFNAKYRLDDRDNGTPRDEFNYVVSDNGTQGGAQRDVTNYAFGQTKEEVELDFSYRGLWSGSKLSVGYGYEMMERTYLEVPESESHVGRLGLDSPIGPRGNVSLKYENGSRRGDVYDGLIPALSRHRIDYIDGLNGSEGPGNDGILGPNDFVSNPNLRKYFEADRDTQRVRLATQYSVTDAFQVGLNVDWARDDYPSTIGLARSETGSYTLNVSYAPMRGLTSYAYATRETFDTRQHGSNGSATQINDPTRIWTVLLASDAQVAGIGVTWSVVPNRLDLRADYSYTRTDQDFGVTAGSAVGATADLPNNQSKYFSARLSGEFHATKQLSFMAAFERQQYVADDWGLDPVVDPGSAASVLALAEDTGDYEVDMYSLSLRYRF